MVIAVLPFAIYGMGGSTAEVGIALAVQAVSMAILFLAGGTIGDRFRRRSVVVAADLFRFASRAAIAILLLTGEASYWQVLVAQAAHGAGTAFFTPAMDALVPEVIAPTHRQEVNALRGMGASLGAVFGPAIGAATFALVGPGWAFGVDAGTFLASAWLLGGYRLSGIPDARPTQRRPVLADLAEGWKAVRRMRWFWRVASEFAVLNALVFAPFFVLGPAVAAQSLGGPGAWAWILIALGIGELAGGALALAWKPVHPLAAGTGAIAAWMVPLVLMATAAPVGAVAAGAALAGAAFAVFEALWETAKQDNAPAALQARLSSFDHLGSLGLVPIGYLLGAVMLGTVGASTALIAGAVIVLAATVSVAGDPSVRSVRFGEVHEPRAFPA